MGLLALRPTTLLSVFFFFSENIFLSTLSANVQQVLLTNLQTTLKNVLIESVNENDSLSGIYLLCLH